MISIHRNSPSGLSGDVRIKIVGLGGAGSNAVDRLVLDGPSGVEVIAVNTDMQSLTGSVAPEKIQLGRATTRGLGAGGDPEVGYAAAEESVEELRSALAGSQIVILCVGLGGGTGSGAGRIVAAIAREAKAYVISVATLPFTFEGRRRMAQAEEALGALQRNADMVICFENDRMGDTVSPLAGIQEAFSVADQTISQTVRALASMVRQRGLVHIGFDDLATVLKGAGDVAPRCLFGYGEADGDNRAHEALAKALRCPLMDKGRMLEDARNILISVSGGPAMTLNEVQILMEEFNRHISDQTRLHFGTSVDARLGNKIAVTILSAIDGSVHRAAVPAAVPARTATRGESSPVSVATASAASVQYASEPTPAAVAPPAHTTRQPEPEPEPEPEREAEPEPEPIYLAEKPAPVAPLREPAPTREFIQPEPVISYVETDEAVFARTPAPVSSAMPTHTPSPMPAAGGKAGKSKSLAKQEQMQFEPVTRGRFEKSEPTIVDGQDLDVPTFLRRNVKVK